MRLFTGIIISLLFIMCSCNGVNKNTEVDEIDGACVNVILEGKKEVFIILTQDGSINRDGDLIDTTHVLCIGNTTAEPFNALKTYITPDLLSYCGKTIGDSLKAKTTVKIIFHTPYYDKSFDYYTEEPFEKLPPAIRLFVNRSIDITDKWYKEQRKLN